MSASENQSENKIQRIFISYAREDLQWAEERARVADNLGWNVFIDKETLRAGENWPEALLTNLAEADRIWLGWSKYAAQSDWVRREYTAALDKEPGRLFIDRLDDTPLPESLKHIQAERWTFARPASDDLIRDAREDIATGPLRPGRLLRPEFAVVPFTGRDALVQEILAWCASDPLFRVALYTGPGGAGKTRLFIEICVRLQANGWDAGFLHSENFEKQRTADPDLVDALLHPRLPRLMVLDYAETRRAQVEALFQRAVDKKTGQPIRMVLLARSEGDWWDALLGSSFAFEELAGDGATPHPLPPLAPDLDARCRIFETAAAAFATLLDRPMPPVPDLAGRVFDRVLFLHVVALAAVYGELSPDSQALFEAMLKHEQRYWEGRAKALGLDQLYHPTLGACAALMTLVGGSASVEALAAVLGRNPDLAGESLLQRKRMAQVFADLYGADDRIEALQPDLLGENLVAGVFRKAVPLRTVWLTGAAPEEIHNGLTVLNRTVAHTSEAAAWLKEVVCGDIERLARSAISVAIENGDPIGRILAACLEAQPDPAFSARLVDELPHKTVALRELALVITSQALQNTSEKTERARLMNDLAERLSDLNRREEALDATQEAVEIRRTLAQQRPDAFLPDLAQSLNNLSHRFNQVGQLEDSLEAIKEAVEIRRILVQQRPDAFLPVLAGSLNNLSLRLNALGRQEEALEAIKEAVEIRRKLAQQRSDAFLPDLAQSLDNLGIALDALGRREEAFEAAQEAVQVFRRLARQRPDAFLPNLAGSLNNLGLRLHTLGRWEEALEATQEAVQVFRRLAKQRPDAFLPNLAGSLNNLSLRLKAQGQREEAFGAAQEAVTILLSFFLRFPVAFARDMATFANNYVQRAQEAGREPDTELLAQVAAVFEALKREEGET